MQNISSVTFSLKLLCIATSRKLVKDQDLSGFIGVLGKIGNTHGMMIGGERGFQTSTYVLPTSEGHV